MLRTKLWTRISALISPRTITLLFGAVFLICIIPILPSIGSTFMGNAKFGSIDFIEYWSAYRLALEGGPIYDPAEMLRIQSSVRSITDPIMMWNPPWALVVLLPLVSLPYAWGVASFVVANFFLALASIVLLHGLLKEQLSKFDLDVTTTLIIGVTFPPLWNSLAFGQLGSVSLFGMSLLFFALHRNHVLLMALALVLLSLKPHLLYLPVAVILWHQMRIPNYRFFVALIGFGCGTVLLTEFLFPFSIMQWIEATISPPKGVASTREWVGPTIFGTLRAYWGEQISSFQSSLAVALSGGALVIALMLLLRRRSSVKSPWALSTLVVASILCAPFGWFFDQTVLLFPFILTAGKLLEQRRINAYALLLTCSLISFLASQYFLQFQRQMFFFPIVIGFFLWYAWLHESALDSHSSASRT